jgi:hypothetical protein
MRALELFEALHEWSYFKGVMDSYVGGENKIIVSAILLWN